MTMESSGVSPDTFRHLLGAFASGVTVMTTREPGGTAAGMTASAFCSLSLSPPLVLVCVAHESGFHDTLRAAQQFAVNILAEDQAALSERFAGTWTERFTGVVMAVDRPDRPPLIGGTAGYLLCETVDVHPGGDHAIFVARVVGGEAHGRPPLLHVHGTYRRLHP